MVAKNTNNYMVILKTSNYIVIIKTNNHIIIIIYFKKEMLLDKIREL